MSCIQMVKYALGSVADTTYNILLYTAIYQYMSCIQMVIMCTPQCCGYYYILLCAVPVHELNTDGNNVWYSEVLRILLHTAIYRHMSCIHMVIICTSQCCGYYYMHTAIYCYLPVHELYTDGNNVWYSEVLRILLHTAIYRYMSCIQMVIICTPQCCGYFYILRRTKGP